MSPEEVSEYAQTLGKPVEEAMLQEMLQNFIHLRILRDKDQNGRYELRHDALATKIYEKITLVEKEVLEIKQFIENAYAIFEKRKIYLESDGLSYIAPYEDKLFINKTLSDFIENSKRNISARKRAFTRTLSYSFIGFFIIIISLIIYYFRSSINARSEELTTEAFLQTGFSPTLGFHTALNAYNKDTASTIAIKALFDAFYAMLDGGPYYDTLGNQLNPQKAIFDFTPCNSKISQARFSEDGKFIYGFLEDNTINLWDIKGKLVFSKRDNQNPIVSLKLSPDNEYIAAAFWDSTATIWNIDGEPIYNTSVVFNPLNPLNIIDFSPDRNIIAILKGNNRITVYNLEDSTYYELEGHTGEVNGSVFSPDAKFIASASKDSTVIIWQYNDSSGYFQKVNRLKRFKSIVWSVDFAQNSKYILCVTDSVDYPINIYSLTGSRVFDRLFYNDTLEKRFLTRFPNNYYGRYFSAAFNANDEAIRISTFSEKLSLSQKLDFDPSVKYKGYNQHRIIYSKESYHLIRMNKLLRNYGVDRKGKVLDPANQLNYTYSFIDVSAEYIATNISGTTYSSLIHLDRLPIRRFDGIQPTFSPDGNYLLCIDGGKLRLFPVDEKELIRLVTKESIFGKLNIDANSWIHFLKDF